MTNEEKILAEFSAFFQEEKKEAEIQVSNSLNINAVEKLKEITLKAKQYTIEDVTPFGYGND
jgi:hypothetical protein